jgi:hypothetical protein
MKLEPDEIRNYQQDAFFESQNSTDNNLNPFTVFVAVLAAILVAWLVREAYLEWQINRALLVFNQQMEMVGKQSQLQAQAIQKAMQDSLLRQQQEANQQRIAQHQLEIERQAAISAQIEERNKRSQAWENYYKPSAECINDNGQNLMKCANEHAKAKKDFEAQWSGSH